MVEGQGKVSEKSGNFEKGINWQPCFQERHEIPKWTLLRKSIGKIDFIKEGVSISPKCR